MFIIIKFNDLFDFLLYYLLMFLEVNFFSRVIKTYRFI